MAKTIKFNLICDGKPIRGIEDLQNNFSIEDLLSYYDNKLLHRWLKVRGFEDEFKKVEAIAATEKTHIGIIKKLIDIFSIEIDENKINENIYMLEYLNEREKRVKLYEKENYKISSIINDYYLGYEKIIQDIIDNKADISKVKISVNELIDKYLQLIKMNRKSLFYKLYYNAPIAILIMMMNKDIKDYHLSFAIKMNDDNGFDESDIEENDKKIMYKDICKMLDKSTLAKILGENLKSFSGTTESYWKDIEPKGKKFLIFNIEQGDYVRAAGKTGSDLGFGEIHNRFVIIDGIDYKSNSNTNELLYMEV